jgi:uncharacterized protein YlzI (FlbEa/FlbD family)
MFIELTDVGGDTIIVNCDYIKCVRAVPPAYGDYTRIAMAGDGGGLLTLTVQETYNEVRELLNFKIGQPWSQ